MGVLGVYLSDHACPWFILCLVLEWYSIVTLTRTAEIKDHQKAFWSKTCH